jgi:DNA-binding LytR/AlgR family response regulator
MKLNCVIVEDEPLAMDRMRQYVGKVPQLHLLASFDNGLDAIQFLRDHSVDLLFLDIHLGELSGIRMLETHRLQGQVILTTAYHEYALKGYDLNVTDYLLKPFTFERFLQGVDKALAWANKASETTEIQQIFVKTEYRLEKVKLEDIIWIEGMRDYRRIHTTTQRIMTLQTFREFEQILPQHRICRIHKSFMVNLSRVEGIEKEKVRIGNQRLPISETYRERFWELMKGGG